MACWRIYFQLNRVIIGDVMDGLFPVRHKLLPNCKIRSIRNKATKMASVSTIKYSRLVITLSTYPNIDITNVYWSLLH